MIKLNKNQKQAVEYNSGPLVINAGPGTGKTRTLVSKIQYLIENKLANPNEILALTFTEKAAKEIAGRISESINSLQTYKSNNSKVNCHTFHGLAYKILSKDEKIQIISPTNKREILEKIANSDINLKDLSLRDVELKISKAKNLSALEKYEGSLYKAVASYNLELDKLGVIDFDDLLIQAYESLKSDNSKQKKYSYILIDEFQDTNALQYEIAKLLVGENQNICVIGDPLQSIYGFRGSNAEIFDKFKQDFSNFTEINLNINYRSNQLIIDTSHKLFPESLKLSSHKEKTKNDNDGEIKIIETLNEYTEAYLIIREISKKIGGIDLNQASNFVNSDDLQEKSIENLDSESNFSDFGIIYRTHTLSKILLKKFKESGIPYQIVGEGSVYEKPEIQFIINCFKFLQNKSIAQSDEYLLKLLKSKYTSFSKSLIKKIEQLIVTENIEEPVYTKLELIINQKNLKSQQQQKLNNLLNILDSLKREASEMKIIQIVDLITAKFELEKFSVNEKNILGSINEFKSMIFQFNKFEHSQESITEFISYYEKIEENNYFDQRANSVAFLTIHAAKGLEFKNVFIMGFEDGYIPFIKSDEPKLEQIRPQGGHLEEKRLLYVAITRAKNNLYFTKTKNRFRRSTLASRFEDLLTDDDLISVEEDEMTEKIEKKNFVRKEKKRQIRMF